MINTDSNCKEVNDMPKAKSSNDIWEDIINSLVLETEPPSKYIKDAIVVTKSGSSYKLSATDFVEFVAREKSIPPEQSEIQHCSVSIDFTRIKRDVNKWSLDLINQIESKIPPINLGKKKVTSKVKSKTKKPLQKTVTRKKRKID